MSPTRFYRLKQRDLPWGDYSDILAHGMATRSEDGNSLELERTGPFMPPISIPSWDNVVVTAEFLTKLRTSGLTGYDVYPVIKKKVTKVEWRNWEPYGPEEMKYPAGGEPENYILRRKHSPEAAAALGELWYIRFKPGILATYESGRQQLLATSWNGSDFFVVDGGRLLHNYVSERASNWLLENVPEWITFEEA